MMVRQIAPDPGARRLFTKTPPKNAEEGAVLAFAPAEADKPLDDFDEYFGCFKETPTGSRDSVMIVREQRDEWRRCF